MYKECVICYFVISSKVHWFVGCFVVVAFSCVGVGGWNTYLIETSTDSGEWLVRFADGGGATSCSWR